MRIYRVEPDVNHFQTLYMSNFDDWTLEEHIFDGSSRVASWRSPDVYVLKPRLKRGNFFDFESGGPFVVDPIAVDGLADLLEMCSELLPINYEGKRLHLVNVVECVNVLDGERSKKVPGNITHYEFFPNRFIESPLFKIPETCRGEVLTLEGWMNPEDEFKHRVEQLGLTGLIFKEIWSDE